MNKWRITLLFLIFEMTVGVPFGEGVPINSDLGLTPFKGQFIFRVQGRYTLKDSDKNNQGRRIEVWAVPVVGVYGITSKASVQLKIPYLDKELRTTTGMKRGDRGLGDISLLGKYRVYTRDYKGATSRFSLIAGLELPTGDDDERDSLGRLPQPLQLGSGSVDVIAGGAYTFQSLDSEWDMDFKYKFNREANDFQFGDELQYDFAFQKRFWPWILPERGIYSQWNAVLEFNGTYNEKDEFKGVVNGNSGGNVLFFSPGIQFAGRRMIFEFSYQHPMLQDLSGNQIETDYKLALSLRYSF